MLIVFGTAVEHLLVLTRFRSEVRLRFGDTGENEPGSFVLLVVAARGRLVNLAFERPGSTRRAPPLLTVCRKPHALGAGRPEEPIRRP